MKFGCFIGIFLNSPNLIGRSTYISKCFRGSLRLRDDESRLYVPKGCMLSLNVIRVRLLSHKIHKDEIYFLYFQLGHFYLKFVSYSGCFRSCRKENSPSSSRCLVQGIYRRLNAVFCTLFTNLLLLLCCCFTSTVNI